MKKIVLLLLAAAFTCVGCSQTKKTETKSVAKLPTPSGKVNYLSTADFKKKVMDYEAHPQEWVFAGSKPVVIDFYATWCRPCKMMSPIVEQLAQQYGGKVDFYQVDIDKEQELSAVFGIQSIPTFLFIPLKGKPSIMMGAMPKEEFEAQVKNILP